MKVTDYIVEFMIKGGVTDVFGYPGGVICHFIDSLTKYSEINGHINYHEQAAAFSACGYAQEKEKIGVAFATSGPGATNLLTGIADAFFDSIPVIFITGQVDTYGLKGDLPVRQRGFQETDIVSMAKPVTKFAARVDDPKEIRLYLEKAYAIAVNGNPGPVLLDLPADVQRAEVDENALEGYSQESTCIGEQLLEKQIQFINDKINHSKRPCLLIGNGVKQAGLKAEIRNLIDRLNIPVVLSMPAFDVLPFGHKLNFGFIGANGHRYANFVIGKSDLIITLGSRLDLKQVGNNRGQFAPQAQVVRVDIDDGNFSLPVNDNDINITADLRKIIPEWNPKVEGKNDFNSWFKSCSIIRDKLKGYDDEPYANLISEFGDKIPDNSVITADVGQSEVWIAQQLHVKENQSVHISAGLGTMGYSLPAAIGSYYAAHKPVISFNGDGGIQMNIQELQFLVRENLPITVAILNNHALGMIRGFQEANFGKNYSLTTEGTGYSVPDFKKIAEAYGLGYSFIDSAEALDSYKWSAGPQIVEIGLSVETELKPNFGRNGLIQDQRPYLDRTFFKELMNL